MWQRFQTLLLLIVAGLLCSMLWSEMCFTLIPVDGSDIMSRFSIKFHEQTQFLICTFITFVLTLITIGYFKARILQIRLCIMNMLILIGYQIWIIVDFFKLKAVYTFRVANLFPFVCIILLLLAIRYIWRDESMCILNGMIQKDEKNKGRKRKKINNQ